MASNGGGRAFDNRRAALEHCLSACKCVRNMTVTIEVELPDAIAGEARSAQPAPEGEEASG